MKKQNKQPFGIPNEMVHSFLKWSREQGLDPGNKNTVDEWKTTEDYCQLYNILFGAEIPNEDGLENHNDIDDWDFQENSRVITSFNISN